MKLTNFLRYMILSITLYTNAQEQPKKEYSNQKETYYQERAKQDAAFEQQFKASNNKEKEFWKEQKTYEKNLKKKDKKAYMKEKKEACKEHYNQCNSHCHHSDAYYHHASFYYYGYYERHYHHPPSYSGTQIRIQTPNIRIGL